jgi:hypothetical protein
MGKKRLHPVATAMAMWFAAAGPSAADTCWDTRQQIVGKDGQIHDFPFSVYFGALPPGVADCEGTGNQVMKELAEIRADPSVLEKENQANHGHGGRYNSRWACCKEWTKFRCQHYPPPPSQAGGYGSTHLEGYIGPASGCAEPLPRGNADKFFRMKP